MPNPTHPDDDLHIGMQFDLNATDWETDTCLHTPQWTQHQPSAPEPESPPQPQPNRPDPANDIPPF